MLGFVYTSGRGVDQDEAASFKWYLKAAQQGLADAQYAVSYAYSNGVGVAPDQTEAIKWLQKAAEQNHAESLFNLGNVYANGDGVAKDQLKAIDWYCKAAQAGHEGGRQMVTGPSKGHIDCPLEELPKDKKIKIDRDSKESQ
jgi:TPR repeat protein